MATIRQIETALSNAEAAGDKDAVARLTNLLNRAKNDGTAQGEMGWGETLGRAAANVPASASKFVSDLSSAVVHPLDTLQAMGDLGAGALREGARAVLPETAFNALDNLGDQGAAQRASDTATTVGRMYRDRYGSLEGFKQAVAEDPVGVAADLSLPVTGAGGALTKAAGATSRAGRIGRMIETVGRNMDPVALAGNAVGRGGRAVSSVIGMGTGVGDEPIRAAFNAARAGGAKADALYDNMRGRVPITDVVDEAKSSMDNIKTAGQAEYRRGIASTRASTAPVDWNPIFKSVQDGIDSMRTSSGRFYGGTAGRDMVQKILNTVHQYVLDPALHNAEGLDALKQELAAFQITPGPGVSSGQANANRLVTSVLDAVRKEITRVDPNYATTMQRYAEMSDKVRELEKALSLNSRAATDTSLRKLQSTMRNNVQTNYGARGKLLDELDAAGSGTLRPALAGQSLNTWAPRGIARAGGAMALPASLMWAYYHPGTLAAMAGLAPFASPRAMGEMAGLLGTAAGKVDQAVGKIPPATRNAVKAAISRPSRYVAQEVGGVTNEAEAMIEDAKGNRYDRKGRLISKAKKQ